MDKSYSVDFSSDVIRGSNNFGVREFYKDKSLNDVKSMISENIKQFGNPSFISGALMWFNDSGDNFMLSIFKDGMPIDVKNLSELNIELSVNELVIQIENLFSRSNVEKEVFVQALVAVLLKMDSDGNIVGQELQG